MRVRHLLFGCIFAVLAACTLAAQTPALSGIETPYPALQNQVKIAGQTYGAGVCTYGPVSTPVTLWGSNLGTSGTVQFIPYNSGVAGTPVSATVTMWTSSMVFLYVPSGVHTGLVTVTTGGTTSNGLPFIVTPGTYSGSCPANPPSQLTIVSTSLPDATVGQAYNVTLQANGGVSPYTWSITSGTLPSGLSMSASGDITGTPTAASGAVNITVKVVDHSASVQSATQQLSITVDAQNPTSGSIYSYSATYDGVGNVTGYNDSVMGNWGFGYDSLNRLSNANASSGSYSDNSICWSYDSFGNRLQQEISSAPFQSGSGGANLCNPQPSASVTTDLASYNANNQITSTNARGVTAIPGYDASGSMTSDGANTYLYDAEGRICAVASTPVPGMTAMTGYLYDADGNRVAKGIITSMSCDPIAAQFKLTDSHTENYVLGPAGEELTMLDGSNTWQRTNVYVAGKLLATYDTTGLHFHMTDPLGTRRVQVSGNLATLGQPETDIQSLPFGDQLNSFPDQYAASTADDSTPLHFTGKERDAESGNDYFGARYYASSMGRFMSPDPSSLSVIRTDPQTWNRYSYVYNHPLSLADDNGKWPTNIHNQIIDNAFPNLTPEQRQILKNVSAQQDSILGGGQANDLSYMHAMRGPDQTVDQAQSQYNDFVTGAENKASDLQNVQIDPDEQGKVFSPESLAAFGQALHAILDSTSPAHAGFQKWDWRNPALVVRHHFAENNINQQQMQNAVRAARNAFNGVYGYFGFQAGDNSSVTVTVTNKLPNGQTVQTTF